MVVDANGGEVPLAAYGFDHSYYQYLSWDVAEDTYDDFYFVNETGYYIVFKDEVPAGDYTYQVHFKNGDVLTVNLNFPGPVDMPMVDSSTMMHEWLDDGTLQLSWTNPDGDFDDFRIVMDGENNNSYCYIQAAPDEDGQTTVRLLPDQLEELRNTYFRDFAAILNDVKLCVRIHC